MNLIADPVAEHSDKISAAIVPTKAIRIVTSSA